MERIHGRVTLVTGGQNVVNVVPSPFICISNQRRTTETWVPGAKSRNFSSVSCSSDSSICSNNPRSTDTSLSSKLHPVSRSIKPFISISRLYSLSSMIIRDMRFKLSRNLFNLVSSNSCPQAASMTVSNASSPVSLPKNGEA